MTTTSKEYLSKKIKAFRLNSLDEACILMYSAEATPSTNFENAFAHGVAHGVAHGEKQGADHGYAHGVAHAIRITGNDFNKTVSIDGNSIVFLNRNPIVFDSHEDAVFGLECIVKAISSVGIATGDTSDKSPVSNATITPNTAIAPASPALPTSLWTWVARIMLVSTFIAIWWVILSVSSIFTEVKNITQDSYGSPTVDLSQYDFSSGVGEPGEGGASRVPNNVQNPTASLLSENYDNYTFTPNLKVPDVKVPALNCE